MSLAAPVLAQAEQTPIRRPAPNAIEPPEIPIGTEANTPIPEIAAVAPQRSIPASITFKVGTWNLVARKPGETEPPPLSAAPKKKNWRHTFGAERRTAQWRTLQSGGFGADIIALQGVKGVRTVRRLFPARHYHVLASRQLLSRSTAPASGLTVVRDAPPATTAIAYRRRRGIRMSGFRHFLPPAEHETSTGQAPEPAAITALRLRIYGHVLWIASADTHADCRRQSATDNSAKDCQWQMSIFNDFVDWARDRLSSRKGRLILLGQWPGAIAARLEKAGFQREGSLANDVACTPAPSPMQVFASPITTTRTSELDNAKTSKSNACAATADLTMNLR